MALYFGFQHLILLVVAGFHPRVKLKLSSIQNFPFYILLKNRFLVLDYTLSYYDGINNCFSLHHNTQHVNVLYQKIIRVQVLFYKKKIDMP